MFSVLNIVDPIYNFSIKGAVLFRLFSGSSIS